MLTISKYRALIVKIKLKIRTYKGLNLIDIHIT